VKKKEKWNLLYFPKNCRCKQHVKRNTNSWRHISSRQWRHTCINILSANEMLHFLVCILTMHFALHRRVQNTETF